MTDAVHETNPVPTPYPDLNLLLREVTARAAGVLGDNLVGAYLQVSFALGDADMHSDCDFLMPVRGPLSTEQEHNLRCLHDEIPTKDGHWAKHLEGSYPHADDLRNLTGLGRLWLYVDHGWREMQWSTHCNTEVVRWTLREYGVTLAGPDPRTLVDAIGPEVLRTAMRRDAARFLPDLYTWTNFDVAWSQRYAVTTLCRMLHTLDCGQVTSKRAALLWAADSVDPRWSSLIHQVLDDRERGWDPHERPRPGSVEPTLAFADFAKDVAARPPR